MGYTLHCLSAKIVLRFELHETSKGKREVGPLLWATGERDVGWHLVILYALCCKLLWAVSSFCLSRPKVTLPGTWWPFRDKKPAVHSQDSRLPLVTREDRGQRLLWGVKHMWSSMASSSSVPGTVLSLKRSQSSFQRLTLGSLRVRGVGLITSVFPSNTLVWVGCFEQETEKVLMSRNFFIFSILVFFLKAWPARES